MARQQKVQDREVIRFPLVGTEYSRALASGSGVSTTSGIVGVGVVGVMIVGYLVASTKDQRFVNAIPEKITNALTGQETFYISKRPGFAVLNTPGGSNAGSAIHVWSGQGTGSKVISAFGATNSTLYDDTSSLGSTTGKVIFINDQLVGTTPNLTFVTGSNSAYYYPEGGALTSISDGDFPGNVAGQTITGDFAALNGYAYIMTTSGRIYNSDINSLANWTANSYLSAQMTSDAGIGVIRYKDQIMAFGKESVEFFQDIGNPSGSPLKSTSQGIINIGCISQFTYGKFDDTVVWLGSSAESGIGLYMLSGFSPVRKGTSWIEAILATTNSANLYLNCVKIVGKSLVVITSTSDGRTYVYCIEDDMWHEWSSTSILWQHMCGIGTGTKYVYAVSEQVTAGKVYIINPTSFVYQDASVSYLMMIQTSRMDGGNSRRKFLSKIRVVGDIQDSTATVGISWSDDDYGSLTTARNVDMSVDDPYLSGCGSFRRRAFVITNTGSTPLRLEALELELGQGIH